jgi:hypothetical protein
MDRPEVNVLLEAVRSIRPKSRLPGVRLRLNLRLGIRVSYFGSLIFILLIPTSLTAPIHRRPMNPLHQEAHLTAPSLFPREASPFTENSLPVNDIAQFDSINAPSTTKSAEHPPHTDINEDSEISLEKIVKYWENAPNWGSSLGSLLRGLSTVKLFIRFSLLIVCQVLRAVLKRLSLVDILKFTATRVLLLFIGGVYIDLQLRYPV